MLKTHWFWIIGIGIALLLLVFLPSTWFASLLAPSNKTESVRALIDVYGKVEKRSSLMTDLELVSKNSDLKSGDVIMTFEDSKVLFGFNPSFWLLPYSKMEFIKSGSQWQGRLIYGDVRKVESKETQQRPVIELSYNKQKIEELEFSSSRDVIVAPLVSDSSADFQDIAGQDAPPQNRVEKQLFQTLLLHKKFFQTCFIKYYKNQPGQNIRSGETVFDLFINANGTIESSTVTRSDISDKDYLQCLQMVFARMRFKNFQATESFHAIFPLQVELPQ